MQHQNMIFNLINNCELIIKIHLLKIIQQICSLIHTTSFRCIIILFAEILETIISNFFAKTINFMQLITFS